jgi:hypothetical protein
MGRLRFLSEREMAAEFLFTTCVLAVVIIGLLIMTQALTFEQLGSGIWRGLVLLAVVCAAWLFTAVVLPILLCALVWLKNAMLGILVSMLIVVAVLVLLRLAFNVLMNRTPHGTQKKEE